MKRAGFTLIEVMIATLILGIAVAGLFNIQYIISRKSSEINDRSFANQKAIQMIEELRALVSGGESADLAVLDDYDNGTTYTAVLTTDRTVTNPANALSGNMTKCASWKYLRRVNVVHMPEDAYARRVYVRVYRNSCSTPGQPEEKLAETMTVLKTIKGDFVPTQVLDVFLIGIENVPGWWSSMATIRGSYEAVLQDIQSRNPGMEVRSHWITKLSYGRDPYYAPYVNEITRTDAQAMPYVYFYPGLTADENSLDYTYYDGDSMGFRVNIDNTRQNTNSYAACDQYNHAVRYTQEEEYYNTLVAQAEAAGQTAPEPSLRMLIEKLNSATTPYKNAIIINLHGELLPVPPLRNYSDAAREPETYPGYRVVTHPEQLEYTAGSTVKLRVYPYVTSPDSVVATTKLSSMTIYFPDRNIDASDVTVQSVDGDANTDYSITPQPNGGARYELSHPSAQSTLITLYQTPLRHAIRSNKGLASTARLYGLEYIPSPSYDSTTIDFSRDLTNSSSTKPKNTARWIISIDSLASGQLTFDTRIGEDITTGTAANKPENVSRSYTWIGTSAPATERYQLVGDARHCPYKDVVSDKRYNWNFVQVPSATDWPGFSETQNGWGDDANDMNVDRAYQLYREGLLNSSAIWSAVTGFSYYYYGLGGEFGSDMSPLSKALLFLKSPWSRTGETSRVYVDEILPYCAGSPNITSNKIIASTDNTWYAKAWIGELYPDSSFTLWKSSGNLTTGSGNFYRADKSTFLGRSSTSRTGGYGCAAFFNGKPASKTGPFMHTSVTSSATVTTYGLDISTILNYPFPYAVAAPRPYSINYGGSYPPEWSNTVYSSIRTAISVPRISGTDRVFYTSDYSTSYTASGVVQIDYGGDTAYDIISGFSTQSSFGSSQMGSYSLLSMIRTFLDSGLYSGSAHITQLPYVSISSPTSADEFYSASNVTIGWEQSWQRWSAQPYTDDYSSGYSESVSVRYMVKYSNDNGQTWKNCSDSSAAMPGIYNASYATSDLSYVWDTSALSYGAHIVRVEAYRTAIPLHYSYDQVTVYLRQ